MQNKLFLIETNGMPRVMATLIPSHDINIFGKQINDFAFSLVSSLHSHYHHNRHESLQIIYNNDKFCAQRAIIATPPLLVNC